MPRIVLLLVLCAVLGAGRAEDAVEVRHLDEGMTPPPADIEAVAWLAGHWVGEGLGGIAEDVIAPPLDGEMMGMFRHARADGSINFYEFYVFAEKDGSLTQRLKHFSRPLTSWEEKDEFVEFPLVAIEGNAVYFDGLSYRLEPDGSLVVGVKVAEDQVAIFHYRRKD